MKGMYRIDGSRLSAPGCQSGLKIALTVNPSIGNDLCSGREVQLRDHLLELWVVEQSFFCSHHLPHVWRDVLSSWDSLD